MNHQNADRLYYPKQVLREYWLMLPRFDGHADYAALA